MPHMSPPRNTVPLILLLAATYFVVGALSLQLAIPPGFAVPVWPAAGIALAAVLVFGYRVLPGVFLGAFTVNLLIAAGNLSDILGISLAGVATTMGIGIGASLQAGLSALLLQRVLRLPTNLATGREVFTLFAIGGLLGCTINALIGPLSLFAGGILSAENLAVSIYTWWAGDAIGVLLLAPSLLLIANPSVTNLRKMIVTAPLLMLGTFTIVAFIATAATQQEHARQKFESEMREVVSELEKNVEAHIGGLRSIAGFVKVRPQATEAEFERFVDEVRRQQPALYVVGWYPRVNAAERTRFQSSMRARGFPDFTIRHRHPDGSAPVAPAREHYFPGALFAPATAGDSARGHDALSPDRRITLRERVLNHARDSGEVVFDERLRLRVSGNQYGYVLYAPVFSGDNIDTVQYRRESLMGYVLGVFHLSAFMDPIEEMAAARGAEFVVHNVNAPASEQFLFDTRYPASETLQVPVPTGDEILRAKLAIEVAGNQWVITFFEASAAAALQRSWYAWYVLLGGLLLSGLVGGLLLLITSGSALPRLEDNDIAVTPASERFGTMDASGIFVLAVSMVGVLLGALVMFGWHAKMPAVVQILPTFAPMQYNTALCFALSGATIAALQWRRRAPAILSASLLTVIGILTLFQYVTGVSLGIDELLMEHYIIAKTGNPGRMAPSTAVAFAVIGCGVLAALLSTDLDRGRRLLFGAGWVVVLMGTVALLAYAGGIGQMYEVFQVTEMAVHTAAGFIALGTGILVHVGWLRSMSGANSQAGWIALAAVLVVGLLSVGLWQELQQQHMQILNSEFFSQHADRPEMSLVRASNVPSLVLAGGIMIALLLGVAIFYASSAAQNSQLLYRKSRELMRSSGRLTAILDTAPDGIISLDERGRIAQLNEAVCDMFGYRPDQLIGLEIEALVPEVSIGDRRTAAAGRELVGRRQDDSELPVEVRLGESVQPDGSVQVVATLRDISRRKAVEAEREILIEKLRASNEELQRFAYVCSHDLQEPLRTIRSFSERLEQHLASLLADDERAKTYFDFVKVNAARAQDLINDILEYSRVDQGARKFSEVDTARIVATIREGMSAELEACGGCIEFDQLPTIIGHEVQLYQLFQNLLNNALKYRDPERHPRIYVTSKARVDDWQFTVSDNGIGIAAHHLDRIFDIFQRLHTNSEYPGTGVGLAISKKVVEHHGGEIWATSEPGVGTSIHFTIAGYRAAKRP